MEHIETSEYVPGPREIRIYKLKLVTEQKLEVPFHSRFLSLKPRNGGIHLHVLVDKNIKDTFQCELRCSINDSELNFDSDAFEFLDTVYISSGSEAYHFFCRIIT